MGSVVPKTISQPGPTKIPKLQTSSFVVAEIPLRLCLPVLFTYGYIICPNLFSSSAILFSLSLWKKRKSSSLSLLQSAMSGESASAIQRSQVSQSGSQFSFSFVWLLGNRGKINGFPFFFFFGLRIWELGFPFFLFWG